jgi:O-antigen/teichoic acid export membrane protein
VSRSRGATALALGSAVSGLLAYVFFALVTRALGAEAAAPVAVLWTYWSFSAAALTFPLQHWTVRAVVAAGGEGPVRHAVPPLAAVTLVVALLAGAATWAIRDDLFHRDGWSFPVLVVAVTVGSAFLGIVRGILTVRERLAAVGLILVAENAVRCVLAVLLIASDVTAARYYGLALAAGQLVGFGWPSVLRLGRTGPADPRWFRFVAGASGGQVISQAVLTGGPVALALLGGTPAQVTGLFVALALFRAPYTLALGVVSPATGILTRLVVAEDHAAIRRVLAGFVAATALGVGLAAAIGWFAGPALLRLVFGQSVDVSAQVCLLTAVGSALSLGTLLLSLVAMAHDRSHTTLRSWLVAAVAAAVTIAVGPGTPLTTVTVAFLVAQLVAYATLLTEQLVAKPFVAEPG